MVAISLPNSDSAEQFVRFEFLLRHRVGSTLSKNVVTDTVERSGFIVNGACMDNVFQTSGNNCGTICTLNTQGNIDDSES